MRYKILLDKNEDRQKVEAQEQSRFIKSVFEALNIPITWNVDEPLSVDQRISLRSELEKYSISIITDDGELKIYINQKLTAEWQKPTYIHKIENRKIFIEMNVEFLFQEGETK